MEGGVKVDAVMWYSAQEVGLTKGMVEWRNVKCLGGVVRVGSAQRVEKM